MNTKYIEVKPDKPRMAYTAVCPDCGKTVYQATFEAIARGPRRASGSSALIPIMGVSHECEIEA